MSQKTQTVPRVIYVIVLVIVTLLLVSPFLIPIILAATIALALYPLQLKLVKKNWKKNHAAALVTACFTLLISIPFVFFIAKGTMLVTDLLERFALGEKLQSQGLQQVVKTLREDGVRFLLRFTDKLPMSNFLTEEKINTYLVSVNIYLLNFFKAIATNVTAIVLFLLVMIFCTFSFLKNAGGVRNFFQSVFGFNNRKMDQLIGIFLRDARQVYFSNVVTGSIQSIIVATGVYFVTDSDWFLVFFVTLIFSFVPVIGAAPMAFLFAIVSFFQQNSTGAIILSVLGIFAGVIDNFLRPWLASFGESKSPPIVSFVCVVGGALLLGFPGLFIGLLVGLIAYDTLPLFWEELAKEEGKNQQLDSFNLEIKTKSDTLARH